MPALDVDRLAAYRIPEAVDRYDPRDAILYALGCGAGLADFDEIHLVHERDLRVLPTLALTLGTAGFWPMDPAAGLDWPQILHGEQTLRLFRPLDPDGTISGRTAIDGIADKGPGGPALVRATRRLFTGLGEQVAEMTETWVLRGAGGFGGARLLPETPATATPVDGPAERLVLPTSSQQAMIYRLTGDRNPLHVDTEVARAAGFQRPILHGLSTMGAIARAIAHVYGRDDPGVVVAMRNRFTAPVYPGDALSVELRRRGSQVSYRAAVAGGGPIVVDQGEAELA